MGVGAVQPQERTVSGHDLSVLNDGVGAGDGNHGELLI